MSELDGSYATHPLLGVTRRALWARMRGRRLAYTEGRIAVTHLRDPVSITRDRWSIPHVRARSAVSAVFALGFCHGQHRSLQLTLLRAWTRGRLSELVGPGALGADQLATRLNLGRWAARVEDRLSHRTRALFSAYAAGVRAGEDVGRPRRCPGHHLLRAHPGGLEARDSVAIALLRLLLVGVWKGEAGREAGGWGLWGVDEGSPGRGEDWRQALREASARESLPAPFYLAHLDVRGRFVAGASWVGTPLFAVGHDGVDAWEPEGEEPCVEALGRRPKRRRAVFRPREGRARSVELELLETHEAGVGLLARRLESWLGVLHGLAPSPAPAPTPSVWKRARSLRRGFPEPSGPAPAIRPLTLPHPVSQLRPRMGPAYSLGPLAWRFGDLAPPALAYDIDLERASEARISFPGGQSGNPLSAHFDDFVPTWLRGNGVPLFVDDAQIERLAKHRLVVEPN